VAGWVLPDGLPPGRLVIPDPKFATSQPVTDPVLWVSDQAVPDAGTWWARLRAARPRTGLWPLLLEELDSGPGRPWHSGELAPVRPPAGERDANSVLAGLWEQATGTGPDEFDWGNAADALPFESWPGLAPAATGDGDPGATAELVAVRLASERDMFTGLVPAPSGADALTACGWLGAANHATTEEVAIVIDSWQQRFGAQLVAAGFHTLELAIAFPPASHVQARWAAAEHYAFSPDNFGGTTAGFDDYADALVGLRQWGFWWD
jgi:hypothetical protein